MKSWLRSLVTRNGACVCCGRSDVVADIPALPRSRGSAEFLADDMEVAVAMATAEIRMCLQELQVPHSVARVDPHTLTVEVGCSRAYTLRFYLYQGACHIEMARRGINGLPLVRQARSVATVREHVRNFFSRQLGAT